jgi:hypothetical protein
MIQRTNKIGSNRTLYQSSWKRLLISGLQVRVLPGSPFISPNHFYFHQFSRPRGIASVPELRTSENKTPATRSTAIFCESGIAWVYVLNVVSKSACPSSD